MAKRIMREFALDEISAVTSPAQKGAKMVIMKRDDRGGGASDPAKAPEPDRFDKMSPAEMVEAVMKGKMKLTTAVNGHAHLIEIDAYAMERGGGTTSGCGEYDAPGHHAHPFVIGPKGEITIGEANDHTHDIADVPTMEAEDKPPVTEAVEKEDETMTEQEKMELAKFRVLASMNDAQKAYLAKLSGDDEAVFLKASSDERNAIISKASESDPVVYTSKATGIEYRKSADESTIALAKQVDALTATLETTKDQATKAEARRLAESWSHIGKTMEEKIAMAEGILALPEAARKASLEAIEATQKAFAPMFTSFGSGHGGASSGAMTAQDELDTLARKYADENKVDIHKAMSAVVMTPTGSELYAKSLN